MRDMYHSMKRNYRNRFQANNSGELICFANDAHTLYWNNHGDIQVTVTRTSWPPSNETYYQNLYLPSCDSAAVVYGNKTKCNPTGGGDGWTEAEIAGTASKYGFQ